MESKAEVTRNAQDDTNLYDNLLTWATPQDLGKYTIQSVLGTGGMGVVYKGYDPDARRAVAIKTLRKGLLVEGSEVLQRFRVEAESAGRLIHNKIVALYEYNERSDPPFIAMEYVDGKTLNHYLSMNHRFTLQETVRIMYQLLDALAYSHDCGVVHRDIKPGNIIILKGEGYNIKVTDFGIAHLQESESTRFGQVIGTWTYMSPEQRDGIPVDARTDIYAAGVVFYRLLTGEKRFPGGMGQATVFRPELTRVLEKALAKRPEDRFQTAQEFLNALRKNYEQLTRESFSSRRRSLIYRMAGACAVLATVALVWPLRHTLLPRLTERGLGSLVITSQPSGATVSLDNGDILGVTPLRLQLPAGIYELILQKQGYHNVEVTIELESGVDIPLDATLIVEDSEITNQIPADTRL